MLFKDTTTHRVLRQGILLLTSCGIFGACVSTPPGGVVFHYNQESPLLSLDPAQARDQSGNWTARLLYSRLVELDRGQEPVPSLALQWSVDSAGLIYRFTLRDSVWYHADPCFGRNKTAQTRMVRAADVAYSLNRLVDPGTASPGAWIFRDRLGPKGIVATDSLHLEIHLRSPFPPMLGLLSMGYCSVIAPEAVRQYGDELRSHPVGSGPFRLAFWEEGQGMALHRHPLYFEKDQEGQRLPYLDAVQIHFIADKSTAAMAFLQGRLDVCWGWEQAFQRYLTGSGSDLKPEFHNTFQIIKGPYLNTEYIGFLMNPGAKAMHPALQDLRVRKALHHGTDRRTLIRAIRRGVGYPAFGGLVPPGLQGFDSSNLETSAPHRDPYDKALALRYLQEAGYGPGRPLRLPLETNPSYVDIAQYLQSQWAPLGVELQIRVSQGPTLRQMISGQEAAMFRASWIADYPDAENYLALGYSSYSVPNGPNYTCYQNPEFDRLYEQCLGITHAPKRVQLYRQMDSIMRSDHPCLALYYDQMQHVLGKGWTGWYVSPLNLPDFRYLRRIPIR
jgi:peptide/nickel transport system substrate-binding protein